MPVMKKEKYALTAEEILKMSEKIRLNQQEEQTLEENLHKLLAGDKAIASKPLTVGKTPLALAICGANGDLDLTIKKSVVDKCLRPEVRDENGRLKGKNGHGLTEEQLLQALNGVKSPAMIIEGSRNGSLIAVTDLKDQQDREIIVAIELNKVSGFQEVNQVSSAYGRENFSDFLDRQMEQGKIIAVNEEKANDLLHSIGKKYPKENTFISFDNSIAYTKGNVKYPEENILENTKFHNSVEHERLLPFLNAKAQYHESRLNTLKDKRDTRIAKIEKNEAKINKLSAKADKLEDMNKLLSTLARVNPVIKAFTDRNANKIKTIREEKIPARESTISAHKTRIAEIDKKSDVIGHKLERSVALSDTVKSFAIIGAERRQAFAQSMDKLNKATFACISDKRADVIEQQQQLVSQLNKSIEQIGNNKPTENLRQIQEQLKAIQPRLAKLDSKLSKLKLPESFYVSKTAEHIDKLIDNTQKTVTESIESGSLSIPKLSENICESNAELSKQLEVENSEKDSPFEYLKNTEMSIEDDYNSIDGIINNGKRNEQSEITDNDLDEVKTNIGSMPVEDYREIMAMQNGFDSYDDMYNKGYSLGNDYDKKPELIDEAAAKEIAANMPKMERKEFINKISSEIEAYIEPSELDLRIYNACVDIENEIQQKSEKQSQREQSTINAWHELGDAYTEAYEEIHMTPSEYQDYVKSENHKRHENWLDEMIAYGKAVIKDDGSFKINPDYYKNLPRNDRHVEEFSIDSAKEIMNELAEKNIEFSATTRSSGKIAITVSQKNAGEITDGIDKTLVPDTIKENTGHKSFKTNTVNPDYYKSLAAADRKTFTLSSPQAKEIMNKLSEKDIPYSASVKGTVTKLTVAKENEQATNGILQSSDSRYINPDFYKSLSKDERYTQRMDEQQAKNVVGELAKNGVEHSAVIDGEKSAVTIKQSDYPKAKGYFMNHNKFQQLLNNTKQQQMKKDNSRDNIRKDPQNKRSGIE